MLLILLLEIILPYSFQVDVLTPGSSITSLSSDPNPDFNGPIQNVTVAVGREAILSCTVTDLGQYKVGWMKADDQTILSLHTRVITHNPRISVTHDDNLRIWQLRIRQLKESDGGCYMCQINTSSMKKTLGCVDVQVPPDIDDTETSGDMTVSEGDNVTLVCRATGHPPPRILWRREDGNHILFQPKPYESDIVDTYSGSSLSLLRLNRRQMGAYLCIASNDVPPAVSKRITLNINFGPTVQVSKSLVGATLGSNAKLKCEVEAFPNSNSNWIRHPDETLLNSLKYTIHEKRSGTKLTMILTVHNTTYADYGMYKCFASNAMGKADSSVRLFEIKIPTTTTTTTTTTTELPTTESTTTSQSFMTTYTTKRRYTMHNLEEDPSENWLFPSNAPALLELEISSASNNKNLPKTTISFVALLFVFR